MDQKIQRNITALSVDLVNHMFTFLRYRSESEAYSMINKSARAVFRLTLVRHVHETTDWFAHRNIKELKDIENTRKINYKGSDPYIYIVKPMYLPSIKQHISENYDLYSEALRKMGTSHVECMITGFKNINYIELLTHKELLTIYARTGMFKIIMTWLEYWKYIKFTEQTYDEKCDMKHIPTVYLNSEKRSNDLNYYMIDNADNCPLIKYYMSNNNDNKSSAIIRAIKTMKMVCSAESRPL